jgi:hypothetical protein
MARTKFTFEKRQKEIAKKKKKEDKVARRAELKQQRETTGADGLGESALAAGEDAAVDPAGQEDPEPAENEG